MAQSPTRKNARRGPTIAQVADAAGVSKAGVSRVLNEGYASPELKAKVEAAMRELGYSPSSAAMNFAAGRTGAIALVANYIDSEWIPLVLRGLQRAMMKQRRASLLLGSLHDGDDYNAKAIRGWLEEPRVDGAIFLRPQASERSLLRIARKKNIPVATISPDVPTPGALAIRTDNLQGAGLLGEHLMDLGHERIGFVGGEESSTDSSQRLDGLRASLEARGLKLAARNIYNGVFETKHGREAARRWLARKPESRPTAMVCADDTIAFGFLSVLLEAGIKVPDEVSVTGYNDMPACQWAYPALTTVSQPLIDLGVHAATSLLEAVNGNGYPDAPTPVTLPVSLVVRKTTAPPL